MTNCIKKKLLLFSTPLFILGCDGDVLNKIHDWSKRQAQEQEQKNIEKYVEKANQGDIHAEHMLVNFYMIGTPFLQPNPEKGLYWLRKAAENQDASAMTALGISYYAGIGVPKDRQVAQEWYQKAADLGNTDAQFWLLHIELGKTNKKTEIKNLLNQIQKIAESGNRNALRWLGHTHLQGNTAWAIPKDNEKATLYYKQAAHLGDPLAHLALASIYSEDSKLQEEAKNEYEVAIYLPAFQELIYLLAITHQNLTTNEKAIAKSYAYLLFLDKHKSMGWLKDRLPNTIDAMEERITPLQKEKAENILDLLDDPKTAYSTIERKPFLEFNLSQNTL